MDMFGGFDFVNPGGSLVEIQAFNGATTSADAQARDERDERDPERAAIVHIASQATSGSQPMGAYVALPGGGVQFDTSVPLGHADQSIIANVQLQDLHQGAVLLQVARAAANAASDALEEAGPNFTAELVSASNNAQKALMDASRSWNSGGGAVPDRSGLNALTKAASNAVAAAATVVDVNRIVQQAAASGAEVVSLVRAIANPVLNMPTGKPLAGPLPDEVTPGLAIIAMGAGAFFLLRGIFKR